jgi:hypothetical protein
LAVDAVATMGIVKALDVAEDRALGVGAGAEGLAVDELALQRREEALDDHVYRNRNPPGRWGSYSRPMDSTVTGGSG